MTDLCHDDLFLLDSSQMDIQFSETGTLMTPNTTPVFLGHTTDIELSFGREFSLTSPALKPISMVEPLESPTSTNDCNPDFKKPMTRAKNPNRTRRSGQLRPLGTINTRGRATRLDEMSHENKRNVASDEAANCSPRGVQKCKGIHPSQFFPQSTTNSTVKTKADSDFLNFMNDLTNLNDQADFNLSSHIQSSGLGSQFQMGEWGSQSFQAVAQFGASHIDQHPNNLYSHPLSCLISPALTPQMLPTHSTLMKSRQPSQSTSLIFDQEKWGLSHQSLASSSDLGSSVALDPVLSPKHNSIPAGSPSNQALFNTSRSPEQFGESVHFSPLVANQHGSSRALLQETSSAKKEDIDHTLNLHKHAVDHQVQLQNIIQYSPALHPIQPYDFTKPFIEDSSMDTYGLPMEELEKRSIHKEAEKKRRDSMKACIDDLKMLVLQKGERVSSKIVLLHKTIIAIQELKMAQVEKDEEIKRLKALLNMQ